MASSSLALNPVPSKRGRIMSPIWEFFSVDSTNEEIAICDTCGAKLRRGKPGSKPNSWSNASLWKHLKGKHAEEHDEAMRLQD